jgi:hypothetical protein
MCARSVQDQAIEQVPSAVSCPYGPTQRIRLSECVRACGNCQQCTQTNIATAAQLDAFAQDFVRRNAKMWYDRSPNSWLLVTGTFRVDPVTGTFRVDPETSPCGTCEEKSRRRKGHEVPVIASSQHRQNYMTWKLYSRQLVTNDWGAPR